MAKNSRTVSHVLYEVRIPIEIWEEIVRIADREWPDEDRKNAQEIAEPGIKACAPVNPLIEELLRDALIDRMCLSI
jgi:hypothetical protein